MHRLANNVGRLVAADRSDFFRTSGATGFGFALSAPTSFAKRIVKPITFAVLLSLWIGIPLTVHAQTTITKSIAANSDDAEEQGPDGTGNPTGTVYLTSSDIELVTDNDTSGGYSGGTQTVGLRFTAMTIPVGATITSAYLTFRAIAADAPMNNTGPTNLTIRGQLTANAPTFTTAIGNITSRAVTTASASWAPTSWTTGTDYNSPSLVGVIQEIVNQGTWASGNALAVDHHRNRSPRISSLRHGAGDIRKAHRDLHYPKHLGSRLRGCQLWRRCRAQLDDGLRQRRLGALRRAGRAIRCRGRVRDFDHHRRLGELHLHQRQPPETTRFAWSARA